MNIEQYAARLYDDFPFFVSEVWKDRKLDKLAPLSEVELELAQMAAVGPKRRGILAPRGVGKTMVVTATLSCWRYFRDPDRRILILSKSEKEAKKTVFIIRQWLDHIHFLRHLAPKGAQRDAAHYFDIGPSRDNRQPSMFCVGVGGQTEGNRAHTIIVDDGETKNNTKTAESRDELERLCSECINILYPDVAREDGGPVDPVEVLYVGTLKHEDSLYPRLAAKGYHFTSYPLAYPAPNQDLLNLSPLLRSRLDSGDALPGQPVFPRRFNHDNLAEKMAEGAREWALEHMLQVNYGSQRLYPLRLEDLIVVPSVHRDIAPTFLAWGKADHSGSTRLPIPHMGHPGDDLYRPFAIGKETAPYLGTKVWIDPAGRGEDETAFGAGASLNGFLWIKGLESIPGGHTREDMERMILFGRLHNAREFYIESNADTLGTYRTLFESVLRQLYLDPGQDPLYPDGWKASLVDDPKITHATGQKELRILGAIEPIMAAHRLVIGEPTIRLSDTREPHLELQHQLTRLTRDRNSLRQDGQLDVLAGLARAWNYTLRVSPEQSLLDAEQRRINEHNELFRDHIKNLKRSAPKPPRFISPV